MSTSVLDKALGVLGDVYQSIRRQEGGVLTYLQHDGSDLTRRSVAGRTSFVGERCPEMVGPADWDTVGHSVC